eukprot:CAMPEP_0113387216 /NCGR_PEP_ID=MMETSP0013_2-20120614/8418_1 /TAXON_ID=2843 ORGANISM="Skeletonema costatum, Strain 1716" /NCGR_SAMPLE_ID=MMETSP0013_2 /ASSEMBLY_ACC=CAM_ASM_000158 /LENGTH=593 /DNA_ID=CAMNT_0000270097 /DNA_START=156 /DNA_END=1938 /DNA_ORIENTATION=+ /assembly_acc=CAM_ASM_000158
MNEGSFQADGINNNITCSPPKRTKMEHHNDNNRNHDNDEEEKSSSNGTNNKGAIYITVGPQCSGKTTILKQLFGRKDSLSLPQEAKQQQQSSGLDITIDDQALVYLSLPTPIYLTSPCIYDSIPGMKEKCDALHEQMVLGRTILDRLSDRSMDELLWVMQRLGGQIEADFFAKRIRDEDDDDDDADNEDDYMTTKKKAQSAQTNKPRTTQDDLVDAVEYIIQTKNAEGITNLLPETVDLFIVESIFRPRPLSLISRFAGNEYHRLRDLSNNNNNNAKRNNRNATETSSALEDAQTIIQSFASDSKQYPPTAPLSWGNTNTRPREMITALDAAEKSQRPVHFIIYGGLEACDQIRDHSFQVDDDLTLCLPKSSRLTLLKRNIGRFVETGRYIPCSAIADAMERVNSMVASAVAEANKEEIMSSSCCDRANDAKFRLDYELAKLAGYSLHENRTVSCLSPSDNRGNYASGGRGNNGGGGGEGDIMEDSIILIAEEDRIITITRTTREEVIITTAEEEEVVVVVEVVGEVMPKVLLEKVTIKEETPIAVRMEEEAARIALRVEGEVDRIIIKEGVITRIKKDTQDGTRTNIMKIQE